MPQPKKRHQKETTKQVIFILVVLATGYLWTTVRGSTFNIQDALASITGFGSVVWMPLWMRKQNLSSHSLFIPYSPIFLTLTILFLLSYLNQISGYYLINFLVFYLLSYLCTVFIYSLFPQSSRI